MDLSKLSSVLFTEQSMWLVLTGAVVFGAILLLDKLKKEPNKPNTEALSEKEEINLVKGQQSIDFLERLIKEKYNYHLYLTLLPIYMDKKIPEKKIIDTTKEKIYVSVVGSLTNQVKTEMLKYFTEKGIEIFIHEKIIILMNETDFKASDSIGQHLFSEIRDHDLKKIL